MKLVFCVSLLSILITVSGRATEFSESESASSSKSSSSEEFKLNDESDLMKIDGVSLQIYSFPNIVSRTQQQRKSKIQRPLPNPI